MKALVFSEGGLRLEQRPVPVPAPSEALIRVLVAGICNTDLEILKGYMGFTGIPGHEFVGVVEQAPDADWIGRRVVGEINAGCGRCECCRAGLERHCTHRTVLGIQGRDGAFAEYLTLPQSNLHALPEGLDTQTAVFTEPVAAACEITEQVHIRPGSEVLVVGAGKLGILAAQMLALAGASVTAAARTESRLKLLRSLSISATTPDELGSKTFDLAVEATGSPEGYEIAVSHLKPRGILVFKSTYPEPLTVRPARLVVDEITVVGSRCGPFAPAIDLLRRGSVKVEQMISGEYSLE